MGTAVGSRKWVVYALADPDTAAVRYVGWTVDLRVRLRDHLKPSRLNGSQRRDYWLRRLTGQGKRPTVLLLEEGTGAWADAERRWIAHFRALGADLTNLTDGGEGSPGRSHTEDAKRRMSEKRKGRPPSQAAIEATRQRWKRHPKSPEHIAKITAAITGKPKSAQHRAKLAASRLGTYHTPESKAKMSAQRRGIAQGGPMTEQRKANISAALKGRVLWGNLTPEERSAIAKRSAATKRANRG